MTTEPDTDLMPESRPMTHAHPVSLRLDPEETSRWEVVVPREIGPDQWQRFEGYVAEIFAAFGMDLDTPGTQRTPERFLRALFDSTVGIGISKLTRLVRMFARRFTVQERIGQQVADTLVELLHPHGVAVHLQAVHLCTQMRGVNEERSKTWTSFWRGSYESEPGLRDEFLQVTRAHPV